MRQRHFNFFVFICCAGCLCTLLALAGKGHHPINGPAGADIDGGRTSGISSIVQEMNAVRHVHNAQDLVLNAALCAIAQAHAQDMLVRSYLGHNTPEGLDPFQRMSAAHYNYNYAAENIAMDDSLSDANKDLYGSPDHLENMVDGHYAHIGVGYVKENDGDILVEDFSD